MLRIGAVADSEGSSPRVWGQVLILNTSIFLSGIIPTRVGTRVISKYQSLAEGDHPHAYGDKFCFATFSGVSPGSSPRVWGQVATISFRLNAQRIIPTRMGTRALTSTAIVLK